MFCEADMGVIIHIKRILRCFEIIFGLKINYHKSTLSGVEVDMDEDETGISSFRKP